MLNVTNHKGNTKHNHNEILPYTNQDGNYLQKYIYIYIENNQFWQGNWRKGNLVFTIDENVKWCSLIWWFLKKLKTE